MTGDDEHLLRLGIHVVMGEEFPEVRAEFVRIARRVRHSAHKVVGLLPASSDIGVPAVGVQLGLALAEVSGATVAFVDANLRWPAISQLAADDETERASDDESAFVTRWLRGSLALLTPPRAQAAGAGVPQLARVIQQGAELFAHVLVDLTGFRKLGEHLAAIEMCDGVMVVGHAGRTREGELLRLQHELPPRQHMGVLLVG